MKALSFKLLAVSVWLIAYCLPLTAQTSGFVVNVDKASTTYLTWKVPGDYTGYDSLHFVVKPCTTSSTCGQLIKKNCGVTYANPYSTLTCTLYVDETASFNAAKYYFSIYAYGVDTVAVRSGTFNLQLNGQTPTDGVPTVTPYYTVALDTPNVANTFVVGQDSDNVWYRKTVAQTRSILGVDTSGGTSASLDSLYTKTSYIVNAKEFGVISDSVTDISADLQEAFNYVNGITKQYPTTKIANSSNYLLLAQGNKVILPPGLFVIRSSIDWSGMPKIYFEGAGRGQTFVYVELDSLTDGFVMTGEPSSVKTIVIKDMSIIGGVTNTDPIAVRDLIKIDDPAVIQMENVFLDRADRYCLNFTGDLINSLFTRVQCYEGLKAGLKMSGSTSTSTTFLRCYFSEADEGSGADVDYGLNVTFDQCVFESNGSTYPDSSAGIRARKGVINLIAPYFENNYSTDIKFGETSSTQNTMTVFGSNHLGVASQQPTVWVDYSKAFYFSGGDFNGLRDTLFKFTSRSNGVYINEPIYGENHIFVEDTGTGVVSTYENMSAFFTMGNIAGTSTLVGGNIAEFIGKNLTLDQAGNTTYTPIELYKNTNLINNVSQGIKWTSDTSGTKLTTGVIYGQYEDTTNFNFHFVVNNAGVLDTVLSIMSDGYVGINNTSPASALDVTGNIKSSGSLQLGEKAAIDSFVIDGDYLKTFSTQSNLTSGRHTSEPILDDLTYGAELISNGIFDDSTDWSFTGTDWTIDGGVAVADSVVGYASGISQAVGDLNKTYKVEFDLVYTAGTFVIKLGNDAPVDEWIFASETNHYEKIVNAPSTGGMSIALTGISGFKGTVDNLSVREVTDTFYVNKITTDFYPFLNLAVDDTVPLNYYDIATRIDSILYDVDDSVTVQITHGSGGTEDTLFIADTVLTGRGTISSFDDNTITANSEMQLYITAIGDTTTKWWIKIYRRE